MLTPSSIDTPAAESDPLKPVAGIPERLDRDGLRLLGLSRVPRCAACARLDALLAAHRTGTRLVVPWPAAPARCREQICAPLVRRFAAGTAAKNHLFTLGD